VRAALRPPARASGRSPCGNRRDTPGAADAVLHGQHRPTTTCGTLGLPDHPGQRPRHAAGHERRSHGDRPSLGMTAPVKSSTQYCTIWGSSSKDGYQHGRGHGLAGTFRTRSLCSCASWRHGRFWKSRLPALSSCEALKHEIADDWAASQGRRPLFAPNRGTRARPSEEAEHSTTNPALRRYRVEELS